MENLADLEKAYRVPCKHCAEPMQAWDLFCPSCGKDQTAAKAAEPARLRAEPERLASGAGEAVMPVAMQLAAMPQQEAWEPVAYPVATIAAKEEIDPEVGLVRPGAIWPHDAPAGGGPANVAGGRSTTRARVLIGIAAALLVLLGLALAHDHFYATQQQADDGGLREFRANVEQLQGALNRGDLGAAEGVLDALEARHANDPAVQELRMAFDRRVQERADMREKLREATLKASRAMGPGEPAAAPAQAPVRPGAPVVALPPSAIGVAEPKEKVCNETLAALALCANR